VRRMWANGQIKA